ncbi:MAG: S-adenosylmethionine:tRNA ribosyltransferase-isomerase [Parcubacteria group bacterium Gr01-1014_19]|nr:MAG: S-adenosylmethionine:tRNA ribosyltransferase-isomerase [Parcubacteria group bacterium Gr01-1014_19]
MGNSQIKKFEYFYDLPEELIAKRPASPRDAARLFVYDTAKDLVIFDHFFNLDKYLPTNSLLVLNDTKVIPARVVLTKETGGKIEVLFLVNEWRGKEAIPALVNKKVSVGAKLFLGSSRSFNVVRQEENVFYLQPNFPAREVLAILKKKGATPIPKYIKNSGLSERQLREKYQSVFSKKPASVAAPTASLHFTPRLLNKLEKEGIKKTFVTLDVGLGTFAPISQKNLSTGKLHTEFFSIPRATASLIRKYKGKHQSIVAVGTTVARALESDASKASTQIFIRPPYDFKVVDVLITNFHLSGTSLMMLMQAFLSNKKSKKSLLDLYHLAIKEKFRFYSFGDAMLLK